MKMNKFSNINTFMGMENPYDKSDIVVYGAGFDGTTSNRPGTRFASSSMRHEFYGLETYSPILKLDLEDFKICDIGDLDLSIGDTDKVLQEIYEGTKERSFYTRERLENYNSKTRRHRIILGDYKHEITQGQGVGTYTHSVIDYLDQYGVVYFISLCLLYIAIYCQTLLRFFKSDNHLYTSSILLLTYWGILSIFVRSSHANYAYLPLALAVTILSYVKAQNVKNSSL